MSNIRSKNTQLELSFFALLEGKGITFSKYPKIYGKPDCLIGNKILVFVDSDFWHGWHFHAWRDRLPKSYWVGKIERNIARDIKKFRSLRKLGFRVIRVWEHQLRKNPPKTIERILRAVASGD